jgi:preprotein translocase subunit SecY
MKRNNGFIPGIKPGKKTADYIDMIMSRITLPGAIFLALIAIMPLLQEFRCKARVLSILWRNVFVDHVGVCLILCSK